jgi:hypothetical protein
MDNDWEVDVPYIRCTLRSGDELSVLLGGDPPDEFSMPCDFTVRRPSGVRLVGIAATTTHLDRILARWRHTGEGASGTYIGLAHWLVLSEATVDCLRRAIEDLIADDALAKVLEEVEADLDCP